MKKITITETKEFMSWVYALIKGGVEVSADGKYNLKDLPALFPVITKSIKAFGGFQKILGEMLDLDDSELEELMDQAREELDLKSEKYEPFIIKSMNWGLQYFQLHAEFLEIRKAA